MKLAEEAGKEFFCQVHMLEQLKGSAKHQGERGQEAGNTIRDRETRTHLYHLCPKLHRLRLLQDCSTKVLDLVTNKNKT